MYQDHRTIFASALRAAWEIEDVLPDDARLDFSCTFLPESLGRTGGLGFLSATEQRTLNQIRGHEYLSIFGLVEEFILPFVLDHARPGLAEDDWRTRALLNFAGEEAKHIQLFRRFHQRFTEDFGTDCAMIGPPQAVADHVLGHDPLAVALVILHIEWMTQRHYLDSVKDDRGMDPLFKSLLKHHWMEEASHARLDTLMVQALAEGRDADGIKAGIDGYFAIATFLDEGVKQQTRFNLEAFVKATGRTLTADEEATFLEQQHQALRWTYLGSGASHPRFRETLGAISPEGLAAVDSVVPAFS